MNPWHSMSSTSDLHAFPPQPVPISTSSHPSHATEYSFGITSDLPGPARPPILGMLRRCFPLSTINHKVQHLHRFPFLTPLLHTFHRPPSTSHRTNCLEDIRLPSFHRIPFLTSMHLRQDHTTSQCIPTMDVHSQRRHHHSNMPHMHLMRILHIHPKLLRSSQLQSAR